MRQETFLEQNNGLFFGERMSNQDSQQSAIGGQLDKLGSLNLSLPRQTAIGLILVVALLAFEIFNFDTTQFALRDLLGDVSFLGLGWATILAIAFCAIDFAGLAHLFTPERGKDEPKEVWYLMGAWLLGATMNALMTWWAVSLTLLNHEFGNEVLSRETLLTGAPIFVAVLVWLTRILFIGAFSVAGEHLFNTASNYASETRRPQPRPAVHQNGRRPVPTSRPAMNPQPAMAAAPKRREVPKPQAEPVATSRPAPSRRTTTHNRVGQRPPRPGVRPVQAAMVARSRGR